MHKLTYYSILNAQGVGGAKLALVDHDLLPRLRSGRTYDKDMLQCWLRLKPRSVKCFSEAAKQRRAKVFCKDKLSVGPMQRFQIYCPWHSLRSRYLFFIGYCVTLCNFKRYRQTVQLIIYIVKLGDIKL